MDPMRLEVDCPRPLDMEKREALGCSHCGVEPLCRIRWAAGGDPCVDWRDGVSARCEPESDGDIAMRMGRQGKRPSGESGMAQRPEASCDAQKEAAQATGAPKLSARRPVPWYASFLHRSKHEPALSLFFFFYRKDRRVAYQRSKKEKRAFVKLEL